MMAELDHQQTVRVNDVDLAYITRGTGDPVILVHGSLDDYRSWHRQVPAFAGSFRVIAYSRRYHWPNTRRGKAPGTGSGNTPSIWLR